MLLVAPSYVNARVAERLPLGLIVRSSTKQAFHDELLFAFFTQSFVAANGADFSGIVWKLAVKRLFFGNRAAIGSFCFFVGFVFGKGRAC